MATPATSSDEIADRGEQIYEAQLRDALEPGYTGKFVAIDVNSGEYALGDTILEASELLTARAPQSEVYFMKVGYSTAVAMGGRLSPRRPKVRQ